MKNKIYHLLLLLSLAFLTTETKAQFTNYWDQNLANGHLVTATNVWQTSDYGLVKFDLQGNVLQIYDPSNSPIPPTTATDASARMYDLSADGQGNIWVAMGEFGVARLSPTGQWTRWTAATTPIFQGLFMDKIAAQQNGTVWLGGFNTGLFKFQNGTWSVENIGNLLVNGIYDIITDSADKPVVASFQRIFRKEISGWTTIYDGVSLRILDLFAGENGRIYWAAESGFFGSVPDDPTMPTVQPPLTGSSDLFSIAVRNGIWYLGGWYNSGIYRWDGTAWTRYYLRPSTVTGELVREMTFDAAGNLWVTQSPFSPTGLQKFDGTNWQVFYAGAPRAQHIDADESGGYWLADDGWLARFNPATGASQNFSYQNGSIPYIRVQGTGGLAAGTGQTLWLHGRKINLTQPFGPEEPLMIKFQNGSIQTEYTPQSTNFGMPPGTVYEFEADKTGRVFMAVATPGYNYGLTIFNSNNNSWETLHSGTTTPNRRVPVNLIGDISAEIGGQNVWIADGTGGLLRYRTATQDFAYFTKNEIPNLPNEIKQVAAGANLVYFLSERGIGKITNAQASSFSEILPAPGGLASLSILDMLTDANGVLWLTQRISQNEYQIQRFDGTNWETYTTANSNFIVPFPFGGLTENVWPMASGTDGKVYFLSPEGLSSKPLGPGTTSQPDLQVTNIVAPASANLGQNFGYSFDILNAGNAAVAQPHLYKLYLSTDNAFSANDVFLHQFQLSNSIAAGGTSGGGGNFNLPNNLAPGNYFLVIVADTDNVIAESNENNNTFSKPLTLVQGSCAVTGGAGLPTCNDNGTPNNPADDTFSFILNMGKSGGSASNSQWAATINGATITGNFGTPQQAPSYPISGGALSFTVVAVGEPSCQAANVLVLPPAPCSTGGQKPDMELNASIPNPNPAQWSFFSVNFLMRNSGTAPATGVKVKLTAPTGIVYRGGQEFTATQGSLNTIAHEWTVGNLAAGATASLTVNYFNLTATGKLVFAQISAQNEADVDSQPNNNTTSVPTEDDEVGVNINGGGPTPQPDLNLANLTLTNPSLQAGRVLNFKFDLKNTGTAAASGNFNVKAYISTDNVLSANDIQDGIVPTGNLAAGQTVAQVVGASTVPASLAAGNYFLILKIDADNQIAESDENNNVLASATAFTVSSVGGGCTISHVLGPIICNDNGTPNLATDDTYGFAITISNTGTCGTGWTGGIAPVTAGNYGVTYGLGPYPISGGNKVFTIRDNQNANATTTVTAVAPPTCSNNVSPKPDLELSLVALPQSPGQWKNVVLTLTLKNTGTVAASNVTVDFVNQSNPQIFNLLAYQSHVAPTGTNFNSWTGLWTVGALPPGETRILTYNAFTKVGTQIPVFSQVKTASPADADSTPGNNTSGNPTEDDEARTIVNVNNLLEPGDRKEAEIEKFEIENLNDFALFPNPAGEQVFIKTPENFEGKILILNQLGKTEKILSITGNQASPNSIDLSEFQNGQYFLVFESPGKRKEVKKLVVALGY